MTDQTTVRGPYARSTATRARILDAALAQAAEAGFQGVSVASIAARAGVATGVMNYHFGSKKQLLTELMASRIKDFASRLAPRAEGEDFFAYEESLLRTYLEFLHDNRTYVRLAEEIRHLDPALYKAGVQAHVAQVARRIQLGIDQGDVRPMEPPEVLAQAYLIQGAYTFIDRFLEDPAYGGDEVLLAAIINLLRGGIARPADVPN